MTQNTEHRDRKFGKLDYFVRYVTLVCACAQIAFAVKDNAQSSIAVPEYRRFGVPLPAFWEIKFCPFVLYAV